MVDPQSKTYLVNYREFLLLWLERSTRNIKKLRKYSGTFCLDTGNIGVVVQIPGGISSKVL